MPTIRFNGQEEGSSGKPDAAAKELQRLSSNIALSQQVGQYIAGTLQNQFQQEDLAAILKDPGATHLSVQWG